MTHCNSLSSVGTRKVCVSVNPPPLCFAPMIQTSHSALNMTYKQLNCRSSLLSTSALLPLPSTSRLTFGYKSTERSRPSSVLHSFSFCQARVINLSLPTIHSNYRQVVLSSTVDFLLVFSLDGLPALGSSFFHFIGHTVYFHKEMSTTQNHLAVV